MHLRRLIALLGCASIALSSCSSDSSSGSNKESAKHPEVLGARALSSHYLELVLSEPVDDAYLDATKYTIASADGAPLAVLGANAGNDGVSVLLSTDPQQIGTYTVGSADLGITSVGFTGSNESEPVLESVISLSDRQLLVTFSERMDRALAENAAFYTIVDPDSDQDIDLKVTGAHLEDDEVSVILTTTPQKNALYTLTVANAKSRFSCVDGAVTNLVDNAGKCSANLRPMDTKGVPSRLTLQARTAIARTGASQANAAGTAGAVMMGNSGVGAGTASCTGNPCSSATGGTGDEELIINFDIPVRASSVVLTQAQIGRGAVTLFVSSSTSTAYEYTVSSAELDTTSIGMDQAYYLAFANSLPAGLMVDSIKVRAAEKHMCTAAICITDGRRVDPTRRAANFWGIPTVDTTGPKLVSARSVGMQGVLLSFSEPLSNTAADPVNFKISPDLTVTGAEQTLYQTQILLSTSAQVAARDYTVTVANLVDRAGNLLDASAVTASFIGASQNLFVRSATATSNTSIQVTFSEPMDATTLQNVFNYHIADPDRSKDVDIAILSAVASSDGRSVVLTTTPQENLQYELSVINIKALYENAYLDPTRSKVKFWGLPAVDNTPPSVVNVAAVGPTSILVTFSEPVSNSAADPKNFTVVGTGTALSNPVQVLSATLTDSETQILLTTTPLEVGVPYTVTVNNVVDRARNVIVGSGNTGTFTLQAQGDADEAPRLVGAVSTSNTTVLLRYSRPMDDNAIATMNYWIVQENVNPEVGALWLVSARFVDDDRATVELTTRSQNEVTYRVTVSNVADITGMPIEAPYILVQYNTALFPGTPPAAADLVDSDGDGISDNAEIRGWVVTITLADGTVVTRQVTSDPGVVGAGPGNPNNEAAADSDGDGLDDAVEKRIGSDPRSADTDGDQLTDYDEFNLVFSNQNAVDTDADGLDDYAEVEYYKTNAILADSDGDGYPDGDDLFNRGRDPRVADLPSHELSFGTLTLALDERYTYTDENGETVSEESSTSSNLTVSGNTRTLRSDDSTWHVGVNAEGGYEGGWFFKIGADFSYERAVHFESESVRATEQAYAHSLNKGRELSQNQAVVREVLGATVSVDLTLQNTSDVAYTLKNLEVAMLVQDAQDPGAFVALATLVPERTLVTGESAEYQMGPGQARGPIRLVSRDIYPAVVQDLMRAPRGVVFKVANYDVVSEDSRNFAFGLQTVRERTVGVYIDPGDGNVQQYQAITAGVLNRPRDEFRCAPTGDHADQLCTSGTDCGTSLPCQGGYIIGGFSNYDGTGQNAGTPIDFILQDTLQLKKWRQQALLAGPNGVANTLAGGDDVQLVARNTTGLTADTQIIAAGPNGVIDSVVAGDDINPTPADGIKVGSDRLVSSIAAGDDIQLIPAGTKGAVEDAVAITAGENGVLDTAVRGDDKSEVVTGYEVSTTCDADTPFAILAGRDGGTPRAHTRAAAGDVQAVALNAAAASARTAVVTAGADGFLDTIPSPNDVYLAPGVPCSHDVDCDGGSAGAGHCSGPQKVVRVEGRRDGEYRRFWQLMLPDGVQYLTDFGSLLVRSGDRIGLQFIQDIDRDGLDSQAEFLAGSSDFSGDTDTDGLDDFAEVRVGWQVGVVGQSLRKVFSDPARKDSDGDGLTDVEESDFRIAQCACNATAPATEMTSFTGAACTGDEQCGGGTCRNMTTCMAKYLAGQPCDACPQDATTARTDPRRVDTDGDQVTDHEEVFGYLTGTGIVDVGPTKVILAGADLRADTVACPDNYCSGTGTTSRRRDGKGNHCNLDGDCLQGSRCVRPVFCDDVQVVPPGTGVQNARTVVVAPGPKGFQLNGGVYTTALAADKSFGNARGTRGAKAETAVVGDDVPLVGFGEASSFVPSDIALGFACVDGSTFAGSNLTLIPNRFPMCAIAKPGADGLFDSQAAGDDVVVPAGSGQRVEWTDPLNSDSDLDFVRDGAERLLGSSPSDPGDTGLSGDRDRDGLTDNQETGGWPIVVEGIDVDVYSNANVADTDRDGLPDYAEKNLRCSQVPVRYCPTNPTTADTDGDGIGDFDEVSSAELARLAAFEDYFPGFEIAPADSKAYGTDPTVADTDDDSLLDGDELLNAQLVLLSDGTTRSVFSDPKRADSDADGMLDGDERTAHTDPTDTDTDDDLRLDGADRAFGFDPLIPDLKVTVRVERIDVEKAEDDIGDVGFWLLVRSDTLARSQLANPTLMASALDAVCAPGETPAVNGCFANLKTPAAGEDNCPMLLLNDHQTIQIQTSTTFVLRQGEHFTVDGLVANFDGMSKDGEISNCGLAPNYIPKYFKASCYTRFNRVVNYSDLDQGKRGEISSINPTDFSKYEGDDACDWNVISTIVAE